METMVYKTDTEPELRQAVKAAGELLREGKLVAIPTETVYGLAANALDPQAVNAIFKAKGRPNDNPLIVHIADLSALPDVVSVVPEKARVLMERFWPGPLTVVLTARRTPLEGRRPLAPQLVNPRGKAAVRLTPHPLAARLSCLAGAPLTASSANISGQPAARVPDELDQRLLAALTGPDDGVVVSGPAPAGGVPSTIVEPLADTDLRVLRLGAVSLEALRAAGFTPYLS